MRSDQFNSGPSRRDRRVNGSRSQWPSRVAREHSARTTPGYERNRDLPALLALWPWEIDASGIAGQRRLVALLRRALRVERQRGIAGHWTYDLARHARLLQAYKAEIALMKSRWTEASLAPPGQQFTRPGVSPVPFSSPAPIAQPHSSARPSDSRAADPTSRDTPPARDCNGCAGVASAT